MIATVIKLDYELRDINGTTSVTQLHYDAARTQFLSTVSSK